jgi:hypothetical protein
MIYLDNTYLDASRYQFPDKNINPEDKKKKYCLKNAQAIYSTHVRNKSGIPIDVIPEWQTLRLYGKGLQDEEQYIKKLSGGEEGSGNTSTNILDVVSADNTMYNTKLERRKAWNNVNKQIISLAPKIKDHFYGLFKNQEQDIVTNTIDEDSGALIEDMKFRMWANSVFQKELSLLRRSGGLPDPKMDFLPKDMTELELFEASGGFKLNIAMAMEKLLKHTFHISEWDKNIKRKLIDDVVDLGTIALREDYDEDTGKGIISYVDPLNLTIQYSTQFDYEDSEWAANLEFWNISKLRQKGFKKEFLEKQAQAFSGKFGNPNYIAGTDSYLGYNRYTYDAFKVPVLITYWIDMDAEYLERYKDSRGRERLKPTKYGKKVDSDKKEIQINKTRFIYEAKWIVGTDEVFDYGKMYNQILDKNQRPILPIRAFHLTENPITRRLRPIYDQMQIAWLKYQNAQVMAMNAGYAINVRLLNNIKLGGQKLDMKNVFQIMKETGNLFYSDTPIFGKYEGGAVNPVTPLPGGMGIQLQEAIQKFEWSIKMIEHETGLTPVSMGATPHPEQGKATTELSMAATQNVIRPLIDSIMALKSRIAENSMRRIQLLVNTNERARKAYVRIVGKKDVEALRIAEGRAVAYGIDLETLPTEEQKQAIIAMVNEAIALGRDGVKSVELDDAISLFRTLNNGGNLKELEMKLAYKIRKYKAEQEQKALRATQFQSQEVQRQNAQKAQMEAQGKNQDAQIESNQSKQNHAQDMQIKILEGNQDEKLKVMELADKEADRESKERIAAANIKSKE